MEDAFRQVEGVIDVTVGYCGGKTAEPTYGDVCSGTTGHTEAVEVKFDPEVVPYETLLKLFFSLHDPTNDLSEYRGGQYKSVIFFVDAQQKAASEAALKTLQSSGRLARPLATQVLPEAKFWRAEEYHQQYYAKHYSRVCSR